MSIATTAVPDYNNECCVCAEGPTVILKDSDGITVQETDMCGPCTWGEAVMVDPEEWNK